jgi:hypothetical protein
MSSSDERKAWNRMNLRFHSFGMQVGVSLRGHIAEQEREFREGDHIVLRRWLDFECREASGWLNAEDGRRPHWE